MYLYSDRFIFVWNKTIKEMYIYFGFVYTVMSVFGHLKCVYNNIFILS